MTTDDSDFTDGEVRRRSRRGRRNIWVDPNHACERAAQPGRYGRVRCSAWLGGIITECSSKIPLPVLTHQRKSECLLPAAEMCESPDTPTSCPKSCARNRSGKSGHDTDEPLLACRCESGHSRMPPRLRSWLLACRREPAPSTRRRARQGKVRNRQPRSGGSCKLC